MLRRQFFRPILLLALMLASASVVAAPALHVATTLPPQGFVVTRVGGEHVKTTVLVGPGQNPHTFEPTPRQMAELAGADFYFRIGMPQEDAWLKRLRAANPRLDVIEPAGRNAEPGHAEDHAHLDPHQWTDPLQVWDWAERLRDAFSARDPAHRASYAANAARLIAELEALDREIRALIEPARRRTFLVYHPAWGHFAARYGLTQLAIEHEGKSPGAQQLAALIERARAEGLRTVFIQPQMGPKPAQAVAEAIGATLVSIDPQAPDYIDNLRRVARAIAKSLQ